MQALHFALLHEPPQQRSTRRQLALLFLPWGGCESREFTELASTRLHFPLEEWEELEESQISASCAQVFSSERAKMKSGFKAPDLFSKVLSEKAEDTSFTENSQHGTHLVHGVKENGHGATLGGFCLMQQTLICHHLPLQLQVAHGLLVHLQANGMWVFLHDLKEGIQQSCPFLESLLPLNQSLQTAQKGKLPRIEQSDVQRASADRSSASWA